MLRCILKVLKMSPILSSTALPTHPPLQSLPNFLPAYFMFTSSLIPFTYMFPCLLFPSTDSKFSVHFFLPIHPFSYLVYQSKSCYP